MLQNDDEEAAEAKPKQKKKKIKNDFYILREQICHIKSQKMSPDSRLMSQCRQSYKGPKRRHKSHAKPVTRRAIANGNSGRGTSRGAGAEPGTCGTQKPQNLISVMLYAGRDNGNRRN